DDRHVPKAVVQHDLRGLVSGRAGRQRDRVGGHPFSHARLARMDAAGDRARQVTLGDDADERAVVGDHGRADAALDHLLRGLADRVRRLYRQHVAGHDLVDGAQAASVTPLATATRTSSSSASSARTPPSTSSPCSSKRMNASGTSTSGCSITFARENSTAARRCSCARAVPPRPVEAPMIATGLPVSGDASAGREAQSIAFLSTPGTPRLYSGVAIRTASASRIASLRATTESGSPAVSTSPS